MGLKVIYSFVLGFCALAGSGCGGQLYNVTPLPSSPPPELAANDTGDFNLNAMALDGDQSLERFDANLPLAGIIAVDVRLVNRAASSINANTLKFELHDESGKALKPLTPKSALKRVMKFYGNSFYRIDARQHTIESYEATVLPLGSAIAPQEERRGIFFFEAPRGGLKPGGLSLSVEGPKVPINIKLN